MSRLIDADALYEQTAELEAHALACVERLEPTKYHEKWVMWTVILNERTAFKHDVADAPTVDLERHAHWEWDDELGANVCSSCGRPTYDSHDECVEFMGSKVLALVSPYYCGYCGAKMQGDNDGNK